MKFRKKKSMIDHARLSKELDWFEKYRFLVIEDATEGKENEDGSLSGGRAFVTPEADFYLRFKAHGRTLQKINTLDPRQPAAVYAESQGLRGRIIEKVEYSDKCVAELVRDLTVPFVDAKVYFRSHAFHPYEDNYQKVISKFDVYSLKDALDFGNASQKQGAVKALNLLVAELKAEMSSETVRKLLRNFRRTSQKSLKQLLSLLEKLFSRHARLLSVRVDFAYGAGRLDGTEISTSLSIEEAAQHREAMIDHIRKTYPNGLVGYAWAMESACLKGLHFHFWLLFNGSEHRGDMGIAKSLGEHWVNVVTEGTGTYFNCNANKGAYPTDAMGIGMLHRDSQENMDGVRLIAAYLTKIDFYLRFDVAGFRTFGKSQVRTSSRRLKKPSEGPQGAHHGHQ
ncbi:hypothetical protein HNP48_001550 [Acidovorax soli]|uniref:YagK/YfjJ C-terminal domain-containing protein n=1 Tax=Acidovorax soli TaxID=592050 RepID=A0A7X0U892_9BURK|nr:inovirus-type Gp2 protein [Acidovorax soli]MBB6558886.1 hypothetical protein [Acidovorax soli]